MGTTAIDELTRYFLEAYPVALGRGCPIAPADVRSEIARALERFEGPEARIRAVLGAALDEAKAATCLLESFDFLRRFRLREDLELRARVRDALSFEPMKPKTGAAPHPMEEEEILRELERYERVEEGRTENTARSHRESVASFRAFLTARHTKLREASRDDVLTWKETLLERGNSERTINVRLAGVKALYHFLEITDRIEKDPSRAVRFLPETKKRLSVLTAPEVDRILEVIDRETPGGLRDYFLIGFLFATGGRIGEVTGLTVRDVDLTRATVAFRARKNREDNVVALTDGSVALLKRYLESVRPAFAAHAKAGFEDLVILSLRGRPLDRSNISRIVKHYAALAKVEKHVSSHTFRRSIATILANNGMPAELLKLFLGHRQLDTTLKNYVVYSEAGQRRALEEFHPLAEGRTSALGEIFAKRIGGTRGMRDG